MSFGKGLKCISKSVTSATAITTAMILMKQNSVNNFLKKSRCLILSKNKTNKSTTYRCHQLPVVFRKIKTSRTVFEKGHQRNISGKLFQNLTSRFREEEFSEFFHVCIVQVAPVHQSHVSRLIEISRTPFKKGNPRNISVKLFQNLPSGSREIE